MEERAHIVKSGTWLYDGIVPHEVWIVKQNFDYYYEPGFEDRPEELNDDGEVFHVLVAKEGEVLSVSPASLSLEKATQQACKLIPTKIEWDDHRIQPLFGRYRLVE